MRQLLSISFAAFVFLAAASPSARAIAFTLNFSTAPISSGNPTTGFYSFDSEEGESGTASGLYSASINGAASIGGGGWTIEFFWGENPQPVLTSAFIKAGPKYLWWDATDLAAFNAGSYTSLVLVQNGIKNPPGNAFLEISHAGFNGSPGTVTVTPPPAVPVSVPDGGGTVALLGLALLGLVCVSRGVVRGRAATVVGRA